MHTKPSAPIAQDQPGRLYRDDARSHHELLVIPAEAWAGGLIAAVVIGTLAGLLPATRAARLSPTRALWSL